MLEDFFLPMATVGLAELGDKTQLCILLMATKTNKHLQLLLGVILAFFVVDGIAVAAGYYINSMISGSIIKTIAGAIFIFFGLITLRDNSSGECNNKHLARPFFSGFLMIFIAELGDKTQITSALFAIQYNPVLVLLGTLTALTLLSAAAVYIGRDITARIEKKKISAVAGALFILVGVTFLLS